MGEKKAIEYWRKNGADFDIILMTVDNRLLVSEGISGQVISDKYEVETVNK